MDKVGAVIKYFCTKGMSLKDIHDHFIKTLGYEPPSYSQVKKWAAEIRRAGSGEDNKKSVESDVAPVGIKSYKFLFVLKKIYFAVFKKLMG